MNEDEIKALSERALEMLEEQKAVREVLDEILSAEPLDYDGGKLNGSSRYDMKPESVSDDERERAMTVTKGVDDVIQKKQEEHNDKT